MPGLTMRSGTLQLPDVARLVLRGKDINLDCLTVRGAGARGSPSTGLVWVDGARGAVLHCCTIVGGTAFDCSAVLVSNGAVAELRSCDVSGSRHHSGLNVQGAGTVAVARNTKLHHNRYGSYLSCFAC